MSQRLAKVVVTHSGIVVTAPTSPPTIEDLVGTGLVHGASFSWTTDAGSYISPFYFEFRVKVEAEAWSDWQASIVPESYVQIPQGLIDIYGEDATIYIEVRSTDGISNSSSASTNVDSLEGTWTGTNITGITPASLDSTTTDRIFENASERTALEGMFPTEWDVIENDDKLLAVGTNENITTNAVLIKGHLSLENVENKDGSTIVSDEKENIITAINAATATINAAKLPKVDASSVWSDDESTRQVLNSDGYLISGVYNVGTAITAANIIAAISTGGEAQNLNLESISRGDLDDIDDGTTYKRTTVNEKTGAGRAYSAINSSNDGIKFDLTDVNAAIGGDLDDLQGLVGAGTSYKYLTAAESTIVGYLQSNSAIHTDGANKIGLHDSGTTLSSANIIAAINSSGYAIQLDLTDGGIDVTGDLDDLYSAIGDGTTYKFLTTNQQTGATRAYTGLDDDGNLTTSVDDGTSEVTAAQVVKSVSPQQRVVWQNHSYDGTTGVSGFDEITVTYGSPTKYWLVFQYRREEYDDRLYFQILGKSYDVLNALSMRIKDENGSSWETSAQYTEMPNADVYDLYSVYTDVSGLSDDTVYQVYIGISPQTLDEDSIYFKGGLAYATK